MQGKKAIDIYYTNKSVIWQPSNDSLLPLVDYTKLGEDYSVSIFSVNTGLLFVKPAVFSIKKDR